MTSTPQVHAINCIKDVLKNSRLGEASEPHVPAALRLAADALQSDAWAVRNCGLMLFRAIIDRLLGTSDAHLDDDFAHHKRISVQHFPQLPVKTTALDDPFYIAALEIRGPRAGLGFQQQSIWDSGV